MIISERFVSIFSVFLLLMDEETQKRRYKKAGPNDRRKQTSKVNLEKARQRKLEMLSKARDQEKKKYDSAESSDSESSEASDSDSDVIVIAPKKKEKKKKQQKRKPGITKKQVIKIINPAPQQAPPQQKESDIEFFKRMLLNQHK